MQDHPRSALSSRIRDLRNSLVQHVVEGLTRSTPAALRWRLRKLVRILRSALAGPSDGAGLLRDSLLPPPSLRFVGGPEFIAVGNALCGQLQSMAGLESDHRVLDVGCGIGRVAIPLTKVLSEDGAYEGIDIVPEGIEWCQGNISPRFPKFRFQVADIRNRVYNPHGGSEAEAYRFPFEGDSFDLVFATSLYTHMVMAAVRNYIQETQRVLKPGGTAFLTFFLLNDRSGAAIEAHRSTPAFPYSLGESLCASAAEPEKAIAHPEQAVLAHLDAAGLELARPISYGNWSGLETEETYQDIIVVRKR